MVAALERQGSFARTHIHRTQRHSLIRNCATRTDGLNRARAHSLKLGLGLAHPLVVLVAIELEARVESVWKVLRLADLLVAGLDVFLCRFPHMTQSCRTPLIEQLSF